MQPTVDVHAHVLLPEAEALAAGLPGLAVARSDAGAGCAHPPSSYLKRLYFDSLVHAPHVLRALIAAVGADRVLLGSDYPFDMGTEDPVGALRAARLPDPDFHAVRSNNAAAPLRKD